MLVILFALFIAVPFVSTGGTNHWSVGNIIITDPKIYFKLGIYSPTTPGSYPVLIFFTGLAGLVPVTVYTEMVTKIAEQNVIVIGLSKIENIEPERVAAHIDEFLHWAIKPDDGVTRLFAEHKPVHGVTPDLERLGFLTHSAGGHSLCQYLNSTCGPVKLIVMMNPVDGIDPLGIVKDFITHPPTPLPFRTPALIISAGFDHVPVNPFFPACAPSSMSNDRFYRSLYGPTFLVNLTDYGHDDNCDDPYHQISEKICTHCKGDICNFPQYKTDEATLITSFVRAIFDRDVRQLDIITNPPAFIKSRTANKYDLHNYDYKTRGPGGFCSHD